VLDSKFTIMLGGDTAVRYQSLKGRFVMSSNLTCALKAIRSKQNCMRTRLLHFGAIIALTVVGRGFGATSYPVIQPDQQALATASKWLSVVDAGNYKQAFAMYPARLKAAGDTAEKQWVGYLRAKRTPLGRVLSRKFVKAQFTRTLPGSPDGYYEFFTYATSFQRKAQGAERVVLTKETGHWQVSGYRFQ
jgi:hypothetical protein